MGTTMKMSALGYREGHNTISRFSVYKAKPKNQIIPVSVRGCMSSEPASALGRICLTV